MMPTRPPLDDSGKRGASQRRGLTSTNPKLSAGCSARGTRRREAQQDRQARMVRPGPLAEWTTPTTVSASWTWPQ